MASSFDLHKLGWKTAQQGITLDEMRIGIAYNAHYIGDLDVDEMEELEHGYMAFMMGKPIEVA